MNIIITVLVIAALLALWPIALLSLTIALPLAVFRTLLSSFNKDATARLTSAANHVIPRHTARYMGRESFFSSAHKLVPYDTGCRAAKGGFLMSHKIGYQIQL